MTTPADELRAAAARLRQVAPQITGHLAGIADPVADWLDAEADRLSATATPFWQATVGSRPLAVARVINGGEQQ